MARPALCLALFASAGIASGVWAQPATFYDAGPVTPQATPGAEHEVTDLSGWFDFGNFPLPGETLTVKWARFTLATPVSGNFFLDIESAVSNPTVPLTLALYDGTGNLIAADDQDGQNLGGAGLSFGSTSERVPFHSEVLVGQDGASLPAGTYWLAAVAGPVSGATFGTNWNVTTPSSMVLGYGVNENWIGVNFFAGNTILPTPAPANDNCANALVIGEDVGATPAWAGSTVGATEDGSSPCNSTFQNVTTKDVWFSYLPTQTGWAQVVAGVGPNWFNTPIVTAYTGTCGSSALKCSGSGNFSAVGGARITIPVTQGVPVLIALGGRTGAWGDYRLNIDLVPPPCDIQTPVGAIPEVELCGQTLNDGCNANPVVYDTMSPGQTRSGTLFNTNAASVRDRDYYEFSVPSAVTATVTFRSQAPAEVVIFSESADPMFCLGVAPLLARSIDSLTACATTTTRSAVLVPGTYRLALAHLYTDGMDCASGYNDYWVSLNTAPCDQPVFTLDPVNQRGCESRSVTYTAAASAGEPIEWQWQYGVLVDGTDLAFYDLYDGEFGDLFSSAIVSGATTDTLTISNLDLVAGQVLQVRAIATSCAPAISAPATFDLDPVGVNGCTQACDTIDFNRDLIFPDNQDVIDFINVFGGGDCPGNGPTGDCNDLDFNNDGIFPDNADVVRFLEVFGGAEC
jgi:hypothetical protein